MGFWERIQRTLDRTESRLALWDWIKAAAKGAGVVISFGVPAWAAWATQFMVAYSPLSWVAVGFCGLLIAAMAYALYGYARGRVAVARIQARLASSATINPLDRTFEGKRIRLTDLAPPVGGVIYDKTFVDCELVGPVNVVFMGCTFRDNSGEVVDGLVIKRGIVPGNGFGFKNCTFQRCRFYLITFMVPHEMYPEFISHGWNGLNWITALPDAGEYGPLFNQDEEPNSLPPEDSG